VDQSTTRLFISDEAHAEHWRDIVMTFSLTYQWVHNGAVSMTRIYTRKPKAEAWNALMKSMKEHMYENVDTDTFIL
jgi:hypothetical protein